MKKLGSKLMFVVAFVVMCTLPFDPILNQWFLVVPVTIACVAVGLTGMYLTTLRDDSELAE